MFFDLKSYDFELEKRTKDESSINKVTKELEATTIKSLLNN